MSSTAPKTEIIRADILDMAGYERIREERRKALIETKRHRRIGVGPWATFYFESYDTMWLQIHEMLRIERGGEAQIADELRAYSPLIPKGRELVATVMFEIDDPVRREALLSTLGGVEHTITLQFDGETVRGEAEGDIERTNAAGKTSSVHFIHLPFTPAQIARFRRPGTQVIAGIGHSNYGHLAILPEPVRAELARDFA